MFDVIIIGTGVCGASIARELGKTKLSVLCLEKSNDVGNATTKANSGIIHAGYDPKTGTLMAKYNVLGNEIVRQIAKDLNISFKQTGSLVVAFTDEEMKTINELYERGINNGVPQLSVIDAEEVRQLEPFISKEIKGALYAKTAGVISPWELSIAQIDNAIVNGVKVKVSHEVVGIKDCGDYYEVTAKNSDEEIIFKTKTVINAAGVNSDEVAGFAYAPHFKVVPNKGQYYLLDKSQGQLVERIIFQCPSEVGKGVLVSPTAHGNLIVGPDSVDEDSKEDVSTTAQQLKFIRDVATKTCDKVNYRESIRNFAGLRAHTVSLDENAGYIDEFIIGPTKENPRFINVAGVKSPGLTASPAIAIDVVKMLEDVGLDITPKGDYISKRERIKFKDLSPKEKNELIKKDERYGRVICRCETITEGEIVAAIHSPLKATTIDAVKRRCNAGMGRCQGGFCSPRVLEIIARELNIDPTKVNLDRENSNILLHKTNKGNV